MLQRPWFHFSQFYLIKEKLKKQLILSNKYTIFQNFNVHDWPKTSNNLATYLHSLTGAAQGHTIMIMRRTISMMPEGICSSFNSSSNCGDLHIYKWRNEETLNQNRMTMNNHVYLFNPKSFTVSLLHKLKQVSNRSLNMFYIMQLWNSSMLTKFLHKLHLGW